LCPPADIAFAAQMLAIDKQHILNKNLNVN
jgi:hypothetical protein